MEEKKFTVKIDAPREKVWDTLWDDSSYQQWTAVFAEGSRAETDWKKGSKVLFLDTNNAGMVSVIEETRMPEYMSFKHLGIVKDGVEDTDSVESKKWSGGLENYHLQEVNGQTELVVTMSSKTIPAEYLDYFEKTWPTALDKLKELAEKN